MEKVKRSVILNALGILGILCGTTALVVFCGLNASAFILAAIACYPMAQYLWQFMQYTRRNPINILRKSLPKAGFTIENEEWNNERTAVRFHGKYRGDYMTVVASPDKAIVRIVDMPWFSVNASDPSVSKYLEAMNEVNADSANMSVVMAEPDDQGNRHIYKVCHTLLPSYDAKGYLDFIMCDMLNRKPALADAMRHARPQMAQPRGRVGFNIEESSENSDDRIAPAAKTSMN